MVKILLPPPVFTVPLSRENRRISAVAVALIPLAPLAAPVTFTRTFCPAKRSLLLVKPTVVGTPTWPVRIPVSMEKVGEAARVKHKPCPKFALARGEPLAKMTLSLRIIPKLDPPLQVLG